MIWWGFWNRVEITIEIYILFLVNIPCVFQTFSVSGFSLFSSSNIRDWMVEPEIWYSVRSRLSFPVFVVTLKQNKCKSTIRDAQAMGVVARNVRILYGTKLICQFKIMVQKGRNIASFKWAYIGDRRGRLYRIFIKNLNTSSFSPTIF